MKRFDPLLLWGLALSLIIHGNLQSDESGEIYRRHAVMRGNLVKTVFGNWGVIGQPASVGKRGAWIYDNNGYIGDVSPMVGAEIRQDSVTAHSVVVCPVARPTRQHELSQTNTYWGFEPLRGYFNESLDDGGVALYSDPDSWPAYWPDKLNDPEDPGWSGYWNGFFGKTTTASEECYFVMDDNNDEEYNYAKNNAVGIAFKPDSTDPGRNGLGLKVRVRGMQWPDFLAQDCIFWLYEITNTSTTDYDKVVFGMLVGTYVGVTATEDYREYDDDYSFFDVEKDLTYTGDFDDDASRNPRWTGDVGVVGYAFLESPGNHYDGIDNDGDADDNPLAPATAPLFTEEDFVPRIIQAGDKLVLIDRDYQRRIVTVPASDTTFFTRGLRDPIFISPGVTQLAEGDVMREGSEESVNPNAYDGVDNDLDGLIDENFYLHYRQIRRDSEGNVLIDRLSPVRHVDYLRGVGLEDGLIDERRDDGLDNDGDWNAEFDDVGADGLIGSGDRGEGDGMPTPGEPNFDQTDVDESDQIGLTSFEYFTPANEFSMADDEELWQRLSPGYFEVPRSIMNNKPIQGEDGDFIYGSGYFPLRAGETQRFSLALVYGDGGGPDMVINDLLKNRETVQNIYDSDYRFPPAPDKPTLTVVPGDGQVTLYWDRKAEDSFDPVLKINDFEGYKLYKATDHNFNEVFNITDADGNPIAYQPLVQFDLNNGVSGYFRPSDDLFQASRGASFYLGDDSGLQHSYVDTDVENGRRYFYALVAYDRGDESADIFPKENDKRIDILTTGEVRTFQNTAAAVPNVQVLGYDPPPEGSVRLEGEHIAGTGAVYYKVLNDRALNGHTYRIEFTDTGNDGLDNDGNGMADQQDSTEYFVPVTTRYSVRDLTGVTETFIAQDTLTVILNHDRLIEETVAVNDPDGEPVPASRYILDAQNGKIRGRNPGDLLYYEPYTITYEYYPVYKSPYIEHSPYADETLDTDNFDGLRLIFQNDWDIALAREASRSGWTNPETAYEYSFRVIDTYFGTDRLLGLEHPSDYRIEFADEVVDTSTAMPEYFVPAIPVNFRVKNVTDGAYLNFIFNDLDRNRFISPFDEIWLIEQGMDGAELFTWDIFFTHRLDSVFHHGAGDTLRISLNKPFRSGDVFEFQAPTPSVRSGLRAEELEKIRVVPNPYVVATAHEQPLPPGIISGRGERKIDFIHLPQSCSVHVFTSRGEHVRTLEHEGGLFDGTVSWDLKTKENLDVAAGIYFYVVESDIGNHSGKIAIIK